MLSKETPPWSLELEVKLPIFPKVCNLHGKLSKACAALPTKGGETFHTLVSFDPRFEVCPQKVKPCCQPISHAFEDECVLTPGGVRQRIQKNRDPSWKWKGSTSSVYMSHPSEKAKHGAASVRKQCRPI